MSKTITSLFETLLTSDDLTVALQKRIFQHGVRHQETGLLAKLALHPSLDSEIDEKLKVETAAAIRAAWISRPGRTADAVANMVNKEKRATILTALASQQDLPVQAQEVLIDQTKNLNVLCTLATNPHADVNMRRRAADKLVEQLIITDLLGLSEKQLAFVRRVRDGYPGYLGEIVPTTDNLHVLFVAAGSMDIDPETQRRMLTLFISTFKAALVLPPSSQYNYGSESQSQFRTLVDDLCESSNIDNEARVLMHNTLQEIMKLYEKDTYRRRDFESTIKTLKDCTGSQYGEILEELKDVNSIEGFTAFIIRVNKTVNAKKMSFRSGFLHALATQIVSSPLCTIEHIAAMEEWYSWYSAADLVKLTPDPRKQAAIVDAQRFSIDYSSVLDAVNDKGALINEMISLAVQNSDRYVVSSLMESSHFAAVNLKKVPLSMIAELELGSEFKRLLQEILTEVAGDDAIWSVIESLSEEFEGSMDDLLQTASAV
jgi:hypothetical protein